jgi:hypothetical protein
MKTINTKTTLTALALFASTILAIAQTPVHCCTVIEVADGNFTDKVWMITEPGTTDGFDNGWDGYKFLSSATYVPQVFDKSVDGNFQVSSFPTIENNSFAFMPGDAAEYTLKFTHYDITYFYPNLYLVDLLKGDTIDIYANLSTYKFTAAKGDMLERFKFIVKKAAVTAPVVVPPTDTPKPDETVIDSGTDPATDPIVGNDVSGDKKEKKDKNQKFNKAKDVKINASKKKLRIDNPNKLKAKLTVVNARTGKVVKEIIVAPETTVAVDVNTQTGPYVIQTTVNTDNSSTTVLLE